MPTLSGKTPAATFHSLLTVNNPNGGLDGTLRSIEDGGGLISPIQLSTANVALNGVIWPTNPGSTGQYLHISTTANTAEWHTLSSSDVVTALGYTPASSGTGAFSGPVTIKAATIDTAVTSVTTTTATTIFTFVMTAGGTAKFLVQVKDTGTNAFHSEELLVVSDGSTIDATGYAVVYTQSVLGTFDAQMSGSNVILTFTATAASNKTVKVVATSMTA